MLHLHAHLTEFVTGGGDLREVRSKREWWPEGEKKKLFGLYLGVFF